MTTEFFPEQTIRYKTFIKRMLVTGLTEVFAKHPDDIIQRTKVSIEFPRTQADYPAVVVRFFERDIFNAGVGHEEMVYLTGESDSKEIEVSVSHEGAIQLNWAPTKFATGYRVYKGRDSNKESEVFATLTNSFIDTGAKGQKQKVPNDITVSFDPPIVSASVVPGGTNQPGDYFYRVTALAPSDAVRFRHYFYTADIELAVYAMSSYDRDLIADTLVQVIAMGVLEEWTNTFYERIYPVQAIYPDSMWHFINVNSDTIQGFGETQAQTPWGSEDDLIYQTSYRFGVFGELYSLPPELTFVMIQQVILYPYIDGIEPPPIDTTGWVSNSP